jgi:C-terminal processing protease CtpA/Prc
MWVGNTIYFLSDRNGPVSLFAYDTTTKQVSEALHSDGLDFKTASAEADAIVINRRKVDEATNGRVAYLYVPNTAGAGYTGFNRYFFAQVGKDAVIIDEHFNRGGQLADYIVDYLRRPLMSKVVTREGHDWSSPSEAIYGPKVMIINEMAGSGGDALPWYFRKAGLGPLVGKKTWGGLVGIGGYPEFIDGGHVTAPRAAIYGLNGQWEVENVGVAPDYDVELDPAKYRQGEDTQVSQGHRGRDATTTATSGATASATAVSELSPERRLVGEQEDHQPVRSFCTSRTLQNYSSASASAH